MREIEDAREALDRVERHVKRSRFLLTHPHEVANILNVVLTKTRVVKTPEAEIAKEIAAEIDRHVDYLEQLEHVQRPFGVPVHRSYDSNYRAGELFEREQVRRA